MRDSCRRLTGLAVLILLIGLATVAPQRAAAQITTTYAPWMLDSDLFTIIANPDIPVPLQNRYLTLWTYQGTSEDSKFSLWTNVGDPLNTLDDFFYIFDIDSNGNRTAVRPWGSRVWCSPRPPGTDDRPHANIVTLRLDDPAAPNGFRDEAFPGSGAPVFSPNRPTFPLQQGYFTPYRFESGTLVVTQKLQFARDMLRVEYEVENLGTVARRVGLRVLLNPFVDLAGPSRSAFIPSSRERILFETDFGAATGTGTVPPRRPANPVVPDTVEFYSDDEGPSPVWIAKAILRGNGATPPTRLVIGNALDMFPTDGQWDYSVANPLELRLADIGMLVYYDPVVVAAGQRRSFVSYIGMGVASHVMSNAYLTAQTFAQNRETQGYVGAVQTPFSLPLVNGNADVAADDTTPSGFTVDAYMQNMFHTSSLSNAFAFIDLPPALQFLSTQPDQPQRLDFGSLSVVGTAQDEGRVSWVLQATGADAGLQPIQVAFNHGFDDATRVTRLINIPQGRRFQLGPGRNWRMLTMPFTYRGNQSDPPTVLGLPGGTFQVIRFNPLTNQYEQVNTIQPGQSYWVRSLNLQEGETTAVRLNNADPVRLNPRDTFVSRMLRGWNMVGNPTPYAVPVTDVRFLSTGGVLLTFDQAVASGLIRASLFSYNRLTNRYEQLTRDSVIQPGTGVWIFANSERSIVWPAPLGPGISITP